MLHGAPNTNVKFWRTVEDLSLVSMKLFSVEVFVQDATRDQLTCCGLGILLLIPLWHQMSCWRTVQCRYRFLPIFRHWVLWSFRWPWKGRCFFLSQESLSEDSWSQDNWVLTMWFCFINFMFQFCIIKLYNRTVQTCEYDSLTVQQAAVAAVVQTSGQRPCTVYKRLPADVTA